MYPQWLANLVLVKKANGKYRMHIDFIDLNQACHKDCYLLPDINIMVDSMTSFKYMSSLDAMSGATYQRLMNKIFKGQIGRNMEVYVNDMVAKIQTFQQHLADLKEVFGVLE
ncbi:uncharacterized protein LOC122723442 [Manihot esculenta]|uniref:uncharacterized protein LOC122723442 n=1 Tax=Manihot esculenta TaxID=3983 RepID=UPI001CC74523|nr:uncharacterized protein LOC122723442 [Manihot esculenta]